MTWEGAARAECYRRKAEHLAGRDGTEPGAS